MCILFAQIFIVYESKDDVTKVGNNKSIKQCIAKHKEHNRKLLGFSTQSLRKLRLAQYGVETISVEINSEII